MCLQPLAIDDATKSETGQFHPLQALLIQGPNPRLFCRLSSTQKTSQTSCCLCSISAVAPKRSVNAATIDVSQGYDVSQTSTITTSLHLEPNLEPPEHNDGHFWCVDHIMFFCSFPTVRHALAPLSAGPFASESALFPPIPSLTPIIRRQGQALINITNEHHYAMRHHNL